MPTGHPKVTCSAKKTNGQPCGNAPLRGSTVCKYHGGAAPQVLAKARVKLAMSAKSAVDVLVDLMQNDDLAPRDRLRAAAEVLSRTGINTGMDVDIKVERNYEDVIDGVLVDVEEDDDDFDTPNEVAYDSAGHELRELEFDRRVEADAERRRMGLPERSGPTREELRERELKAAMEEQTNKRIEDNLRARGAVSDPDTTRAVIRGKRRRRPQS